MKGIKWLGCMLTLIVVLSACMGCAANNDEDVVGKVGETPIYRWYFEAYLLKQLDLHQKYNNIDLTEKGREEEYKTYKEKCLTDLAGEAALKEEARVRGLYTLTQEQMGEVDKKYDEFYNETMAGYLTQYGSDAAGLRKAEQAYIQYLEDNSLTPDRMYQTILDNYVLALLAEELLASEPPTDEQIRAAYDKALVDEQAASEADIKWFGTNAGDTSVFIPEGYKEIVRITRGFTDKQYGDITTAATAASTAASDYQNAVTENGEGSTQANNAKATLNRTSENFKSVLERCYIELEKQNQALLDELKAGADFISKMEELSADTHLISYYVCAESDHVESTIIDAAMQLQNDGDVSGFVRLESGIGIIKLVENMKPGVRTYEEMYDALKSSLTATQGVQSAVFLRRDYYDQAVENGIVELYPEML